MTDSLQCWNCGKDASDEPLPLSRQASCHGCGEFLHCCRQCHQYAPAKPESCSNPLAEPPIDKTSANFCEFFAPNLGMIASTESGNEEAKAKLNALFGDETAPETKSNPLDDLFDD